MGSVSKKKKKISFFGFLRTVIIVVALITVVIFAFEYIGSKKGEQVTLTIESGASTSAITSQLEENGIIKFPTFFKIMSKLSGNDGKYREGIFNLRKNMGYGEIFEKLTGRPDSVVEVKVTIPEGYEFRQIADRLEENGLVDKNRFYDVANNSFFDYDFLVDLPKRDIRLEGYLFPDTYIFEEGASEEQIIDAMLKRFDEAVTPEYIERAEELGMTLDEIVILASIIEREAQGDADRDVVSSVFHNRLKSSQYPYLESCATVQYILKERKTVLSVADTGIDSPYNTYRNKGLPIGPIASPSEKSIHAALYPAQTDYLFFALDSSGVHRFASTYAEHLANANS